jgi:hypothetical protein
MRHSAASQRCPSCPVAGIDFQPLERFLRVQGFEFPGPSCGFLRTRREIIHARCAAPSLFGREIVKPVGSRQPPADTSGRVAADQAIDSRRPHQSLWVGRRRFRGRCYRAEFGGRGILTIVNDEGRTRKGFQGEFDWYVCCLILGQWEAQRRVFGN